MRLVQLFGFIGIMWASAAWAGGAQAALKPSPEPSAAKNSLRRASQHQAQAQAEVKRLEQGLAEQQAGQKDAGKRLQQREQTIAELKQKLRELQTRPAAGAH